MIETDIYKKHLSKKNNWLCVSFFNPFKYVLSYKISDISEINERSLTINILFFRFYYILRTDLPF